MINFFYERALACELPSSLAGKKIIFSISNYYTPNNPMAGTLLLSEFKAKTYQLVVLDTDTSYSGAYSYQKITPNFARFTVIERQNVDMTSYRYSKTLTCQTDRMGFVIFKFIGGVDLDAPHHDIGTYFIQ
ncbi:hypothetical protein [uncultured Shewanella sp.]|uniref:hypothetical protein n=1 Tax=uncultured Shewanella sp. TaxID=173975 RepID=UPI00263124DC|nr:hypothetical protein [uncultured Shewanella sp.]